MSTRVTKSIELTEVSCVELCCERCGCRLTTEPGVLIAPSVKNLTVRYDICRNCFQVLMRSVMKRRNWTNTIALTEREQPPRVGA